MKFRSSHSFKVLLPSALLILFIVICLNVLFYNKTHDELQHRYTSLLLHIVKTVSLNISGDEHQEIVKAGDHKKAEFKKISSYLRQVMHANSLTKETLYTFRVTPENKLVWGVMLHKKPFIDEVYVTPMRNREIIRKVLNGMPQRSGIYKDQHGEWMSAYAPIKDKTDKTVGILQADYDVKKFRMRVNEEFIYIISVVLLFIAFSVGSMFFIAKKSFKRAVEAYSDKGS